MYMSPTKSSTYGGSSQVGALNHLYVTLRDSKTALGFRAGASPGLAILPGLVVRGTVGQLEKDKFPDFEENPTTAAREVYDGDCGNLIDKFLGFMNRVNKRDIDYKPLGNNSNAYIYSMLKYAGIDPNGFTKRLDAARGWGAIPGWGTTLPTN